MAKKQKKQPPPPSSSSSFADSYSKAVESPPSAISPIKRPSASSTMTVLHKHTEPSSNAISGEEDEEGGSESQESTGEDSFEDSETVATNHNPQPQLRDSRTSNVQPPLKTSPSSDSGSEDEGNDGEDMESDSESQKHPLPPPPTHEAVKADGKKAIRKISEFVSASENESESSSDADTTAPSLRASSSNTASPSPKPISSKPMDSPVQPVDTSPTSKKRSSAHSADVSEKKRKFADIIDAEGDQEKKLNIIRRFWSKEDELALLQCLVNYRERSHGVPATPAQVESFLKSIVDYSFTSVTPNQILDKIRKLKRKYNEISKSVNDDNQPKFSNAHDGACFELWMKIWGLDKEDLESKFKMEKMKETITEDKGKPMQLENPFLQWYTKNEHANNALEVQNRIPTAQAKRLEKSCIKLGMTEVQLHLKKTKLYSAALELIDEALKKL